MILLCPLPWGEFNDCCYGCFKSEQYFPSLTLLTLQQDRIFIFLWQNQRVNGLEKAGTLDQLVVDLYMRYYVYSLFGELNYGANC